VTADAVARRATAASPEAIAEAMLILMAALMLVDGGAPKDASSGTPPPWFGVVSDAT
jgi:hypothetical protein